MTWICFLLAFLCFYLTFEVFSRQFDEPLGLKERRRRREMSPRPLYHCIIGVTIVSMAAFAFEAVVLGYSPVSYTHLDVYKRQVPKIVVSAPDVKVQKINARRGQRNMRD